LLKGLGEGVAGGSHHLVTPEWAAQDLGRKVGHAEDRPRHTASRVALCRVSCRHRCVRRLCWALRLVVDRCVCVPGSVASRDGPVSAASPTMRAGVVVVATPAQSWRRSRGRCRFHAKARVLPSAQARRGLRADQVSAAWQRGSLHR